MTESVVALSEQQRHFWLLHQTAISPSTYNNCLILEISGELDVSVLRRAADLLIERFPIYRVRYQFDGTGPRGICVEASADFRETIWDETLGDFSSWAIRETRADRMIPVHLETDSPIRFRVFFKDNNTWILSILIHHIVHDGSAYKILWNELVALYEAVKQEREPEAVPAHHLYERFERDQREELASTKLQKSLEYWAKQHNEPLEPMEFPQDVACDEDQRPTDAQAFLPLQNSVADGVKELAQAMRTTPTVVYLATYYTWLSRYCGTGSIAVGMPFIGRSRRGDEFVLGCCMNLLSLRQSVQPEDSFETLVRKTQRLVLSSLSHAQVPFTRVVQHVNPIRRGTGSMHETTFQLRAWAETSLQPIGGCPVKRLSLPRHSSEFGLSVEVHPSEQDPQLSLTYDTRRFSRSAVLRFLRHYRCLIGNAIREPKQSLAQIAMMEEDERQSIVETLVGHKDPSFPNHTVQTLVRQQATRSRDAIAVECEGARLTYAQLITQGERVASALLAAGVVAGDIVAVSTKRTHRLIVAVLGVLFSGAAFVAIDGAAPGQRRNFVLVDSGAKIFLGDAGEMDDLPCTLVELEAAIATPVVHSWQGTGSPGDVAYVSYTSGSSGQPKGVVVEQQSLVNLLRSMATAPGFGSTDRLLAITSLTFDISVLELLLPLISGGTLVIASEGSARQPEILVDAVERYGITCLQATPTTWRMLQVSGWEGSRRLKALCGGEPLGADLASYLAEAFCSAWNMYGPTETTIWSSCMKIEAGSPIRLGRPVHNTQMYVVDSQLSIVPPGVPGELVIGGAGVARGYLNRPELSEKSFLPNPFHADGDNRLYRTGDRVRQHPDGSLEFLGRLDNQLKIRGFRIEPGEIESQLRQHPAVHDAIVSAHLQHGLVAFVVLKTLDVAPTTEQLRAHLTERIETYKVPAHWTFLEQFPLLPSGKVDHKKLVAAVTPKVRSPQPMDDTQYWLHQQWSALLSNGDIGLQESFFDRGGDSLLAQRLKLEVYERFDIELPLGAIFDNDTIEGLAAHIRKAVVNKT